MLKAAKILNPVEAVEDKMDSYTWLNYTENC